MGNKLCSCLKNSAEDGSEGSRSGNRRRISKKLKVRIFGDKRDATVDIERSSTKEVDIANDQEKDLINDRRASLFSVATDANEPAVLPDISVLSPEQSTSTAHKTAINDDRVLSSEQSTSTAHKTAASDDRVLSPEQSTSTAHKTAANSDRVLSPEQSTSTAHKTAANDDRVLSPEQSTSTAHKTAANDDRVLSPEQSTSTAHKTAANDDRVLSPEQSTSTAHETSTTDDGAMPACSKVMPDSTDKNRPTATSALNESTRNTTDRPVFFEPSTKNSDRNAASAFIADRSTSTLENDIAAVSELTEEHTTHADEQMPTTDLILPIPASPKTRNAHVPSYKSEPVASPVLAQSTADPNTFEIDKTLPDQKATSTSIYILQNDPECQKKSDLQQETCSNDITEIGEVLPVPVSAIQPLGSNKTTTITASALNKSITYSPSIDTAVKNTKVSENDIATAIERRKGSELNINIVIPPAETIESAGDSTRQTPTSSVCICANPSTTVTTKETGSNTLDATVKNSVITKESLVSNTKTESGVFEDDAASKHRKDIHKNTRSKILTTEGANLETVTETDPTSVDSCDTMVTTGTALKKITTSTTSEAKELPALKTTATEATITPYTSVSTCISNTQSSNTVTESKMTTSFRDLKFERKLTVEIDLSKAEASNKKNALENDNNKKTTLASPICTDENTFTRNLTQTKDVVCKSQRPCNTQVSDSSKQKLVSDIRSLSSRPSPKVSLDEALEPFRRLAKMLAAAKSSSDLASRTGKIDDNDSSTSMKQQYPRSTSSLTATTTTSTACTTVKTAISDQVISNVQLPCSSNDASSKDIKKSQSLPVVERKSKNVSDFAVPKGGKAPPMKPLKIKPKPKHLYALPTIAGTDIEDESQRNWTQHDSTSEKAKMPWMSQRPQFDVAFPKLGKTLLQRLGSVDKIIANRTVPLPKRIELLKVEFGRYPGLRVKPKDASKYPSIFNLTPSQTSLISENCSEADEDEEER